MSDRLREERVLFRSMIMCLVLLSSTPCWSQSFFRSLPELERFAQYYYLHPQPERVPAAIRQVVEYQLAWQPVTEASTLAYFSCLFGRYPQHARRWLSVLGDLPAKDLALFSRLAERGSVSLFAQVVPSAALNDMYWSCYFATGERRYLQAVTNSLNYLGERKDQGRFLMAAAAQWSLAHYARDHLAVRAWLIELRLRHNPRWQRLASEILTTPAESFSERTAGVIKAQQAVGIWGEAQPKSVFSWPW